MSVHHLNWVWSQTIPMAAKFVLTYLAHRANNEGVCWPKMVTISRDTGLSRSSVYRAIEYLIEKKTVTWENHQFILHAAGQTSHSETFYSPTLGQNVPQGDNPVPPRDKASHPGTEVSHSGNLHIKEVEGPLKDQRTITTTRKRKSVLPELFTRFWESYPRKLSKNKAVKAWEQINPDAELADKIITAVSAQSATIWVDKDLEFIPYPGTWLNQERWNDEVKDELSRPFRPLF